MIEIDWYDAENTDVDEIKYNAKLFFLKLEQRYRNIYYPTLVSHIIAFLNKETDDTEYNNQKKIALRSLHPYFGAVGINRNNNLQQALLCWVAANDPLIQESSVADRQRAWVRALAEIQRDRNLITNKDKPGLIDDATEIDVTACSIGATNKFLEVMIYLHPDAILDLNLSLVPVMHGVITEYCYSKGHLYEDLVADDVDFSKLIPKNDRIKLINKIKSVFSFNNRCVLNDSDIEAIEMYLGDDSLLECLSLTSHRKKNNKFEMRTYEELNFLISYVTTAIYENKLSSLGMISLGFQSALVQNLFLKHIPEPKYSSELLFDIEDGASVIHTEIRRPNDKKPKF